MKIGFTGTRHEPTNAQLSALSTWIGRRVVHGCELHHGDCIGADQAAHSIACIWHYRIVVHPPDNPNLRAWCTGDEMREPKSYTMRNQAIVAETELLIACPAEAVEQQRGGTWSTIRYARRCGRRVVLIRPDGSIES